MFLAWTHCAILSKYLQEESLGGNSDAGGKYGTTGRKNGIVPGRLINFFVLEDKSCRSYHVEESKSLKRLSMYMRIILYSVLIDQDAY